MKNWCPEYNETHTAYVDSPAGAKALLYADGELDLSQWQAEDEVLIEAKPTWNTIDSTKLSEYMRCPRSYFFKYILGWKSDSDRNDLHFGSCWHLAMEYILLHGYTADSILAAYQLFDEKYREKFPEYTDDMYFPKVPGVVLQALPAYCGQYMNDPRDYDVLYTEVAGTVPISTDRLMTFKIDSILRSRITGRIRSREHKTGSRNSRTWQDKFKLSTQVGTYDHVLKCLYGPDSVDCIEINGALFMKGDKRKGDVYGRTEFLRIEIPRYADMSNDWLWNVNRWFDYLLEDMDRLASASDVDACMKCFAKNTESCTDFFGCPYMDFCLTWANPMQHIDQVPIGFIEEHWNPLSEETIKTRMAL